MVVIGLVRNLLGNPGLWETLKRKPLSLLCFSVSDGLDDAFLTLYLNPLESLSLPFNSTAGGGGDGWYWTSI